MGEKEDARWRRIQRNQETLVGVHDAVIMMVRLNVGPDNIHEFPEYAGVDIDTRYVEAAAFYYWLLSSLMLNSTDYEFKHDFGQMLADMIVQSLPGVAPILAARYQEYAYGESAPLRVLASKAGRRFLQHMDPSRPVAQHYVDPDFGEGVLESAKYLFKQIPPII